MRSVIKTNGGATLIEILFAAAIFGILLLVSGMLLISNQRSAERAQDKIQIQMQADQALSFIREKVMEAGTVLKPGSEEFRTVAYDYEAKIYRYGCFLFDDSEGVLSYYEYTSNSRSGDEGDRKVIMALDYQEIVRYIKQLVIDTIPPDEGSLSPDNTGLLVNLLMKRNDAEKSYSTQIFCRNWPLP